MSFLLPTLTCKKEVDQVIKSTAEKVLVLRFGRDEDPVCLQLDDILSKTSSDLSKMAAIYLVDVDRTPVYTQYFDISYIPSTVFFFNGQHMKVDYGKWYIKSPNVKDYLDENWLPESRVHKPHFPPDQLTDGYRPFKDCLVILSF
ncbi:thioredoxin-like protein 4B isoform X3 [Nycticebus coucang]|uniref:thioredoxin-like protein 4B isoform X3 n=1 Tax=Nycticebus coucang TaxID=9470 RepID=UPI00234D49E3|nr:thioredoxin-like protein 4B isoform X3 [Nycticebus coucang]